MTSKKTDALRVSQIELQLVLVNKHDAPVRADPLVFVGTDTGSAVEHLTACIGNLPAHLAAAANPPDEPAEAE